MAPPRGSKPDTQRHIDEDLSEHDYLGEWSSACETPRSASFPKPHNPSIAASKRLPSTADVPATKYKSESPMLRLILKALRFIFKGLLVVFMCLIIGLIAADFMSTNLWKSIRPTNSAWSWFIFILEIIVENSVSFNIRLSHVVVGFLCDAIQFVARRGGGACHDLVSRADQAYMELAKTITLTGRAPALAQDAAAAAFRW